MYTVILLLTGVAITGGQEIVCSLSDWAQYRPGRGKFTLDDVNPTLCTIINYSFGFLNSDTLTLDVKNTEFLKKYSEKMTHFKRKNKKLKSFLAMGGWSDSKDGGKYSRLISNARNRKNFVDNAMVFLKKYGFDGLDLNWEYPVCWHAQCDDSRSSESTDYAILIRDIRKAFDKQRLFISASVSGSKYIIDRAYDVPNMGRYLHLINVLTYDFSGTYRGVTSHNGAMSFKSGDTSDNLNVEYALKYWENKGAPKNKLTLGIPFFGRSFTLAQKEKNGLYAPIKGTGKAAEYTEEPGYMGYNEVCERVTKKNWTVKRVSGVGPYAYQGDQWISYDDPRSAATKARYAKDNGYAGVKIWELTTDDFTGYCCNVKFPMLKALNYGLFRKGISPENMRC